MVRLLCLLLAAALAAGCKSPPRPSLDPFLGRATVPPPKPGEVVTQRTDPYYASAPPAPSTATNRLTPPAGSWSNVPPAAPIDSTARAPIRQQSYQQPIQIIQPVQNTPNGCPPGTRPVRMACPEEVPPGARSAPANVRSAGVPTPASDSVAAFRRAGVPGEPTPARAVSAMSDPNEPQRLEVDSRARDIMDLPPATRPGTPAQSNNRIKPASYEEPTVATAAPSATIRSRYGYDSSYKWLKGQLEYSKAARRWKLRYVPLDGDTDEYGGSVVLADSPRLEKFQPGDYVLVEGRIEGRDDKNGSSFSPLYQVSRIDRSQP